MILVGVSGGVAAYKSCELVRLLVKAGREVQVVMTPALDLPQRPGSREIPISHL